MVRERQSAKRKENEKPKVIDDVLEFLNEEGETIDSNENEADTDPVEELAQKQIDLYLKQKVSPFEK